MSKYSDSLTLRVPPANALALGRQAVEVLGWTTQSVEPSGFRCTTGWVSGVTMDVVAMEAPEGATVQINAEKRFALGPLNESYLRNRVEEFKQGVQELAVVGQGPGSTHLAATSGVVGTGTDPAARADFKAFRADSAKPPETAILGMNKERDGEGPGGQINWPTSSGTGGEIAAGDARKGWRVALEQVMQRDPQAQQMSLEDRLRCLIEVERDVEAGKVALSPQERKELTEARIAAQSDLFHHRGG